MVRLGFAVSRVPKCEAPGAPTSSGAIHFLGTCAGAPTFSGAIHFLGTWAGAPTFSGTIHFFGICATRHAALFWVSNYCQSIQWLPWLETAR